MSTETIKSVESASPLSTAIVAALPATGRDLINKNGKITGREAYLGTEPASVLRDRFKAAGFKGNDLKAKVNEALSSDASARKLNAFAAIEFAHVNHGMLPDTATLRKNSLTIKSVTAGKATDSVAQQRLSEMEKKNAEQELALIELREQMKQLMAANKPAQPTLPGTDTKRK